MGPQTLLEVLSVCFIQSCAKVFFNKDYSNQLYCFFSVARVAFSSLFSLFVLRLLAKNYSIKMYCILGAKKLRRKSSSPSTNAVKIEANYLF